MNIIKLERVSKSFRLNDRNPFLKSSGKLNPEFSVLKDISFELGKGEALAVLGPNGAGKSTLLRVISGIMKQDEGIVSVHGNLIPVFDTGSLFRFELSGRENVYYYGSLLGYSKSYLNQKMKEIIEFSELGTFIDAQVKKYSLGMIARLAFSIATVSYPDVLIIDEVQSVGDRIFRQKSFNRILSMKSKGVTVVYVTQSADEVIAFADKALYLDRGVVRKYGEPSDVTLYYVEKTDAKLKQRLDENITKLYNRWKSGAEIIPDPTPEKRITGISGLPFFTGNNKNQYDEPKEIRNKLQEEIRLLKYLLNNDVNLLRSMFENDMQKTSERQQIIDKLHRLQDLVRIELEICDGSRDALLNQLEQLKKDELNLVMHDNQGSFDQDLIKIRIKSVRDAKDPELKSKLIASLYGLRNLSNIDDLNQEEEKALIEEYLGCFLEDTLLDNGFRTSEFFRFLLTISAFNDNLDRACLDRLRNSFFEYLRKNDTEPTEFYENISGTQFILNWENDNFVYQIIGILESFSRQQPNNKDFLSYLKVYSQKASEKIKDKLLHLSLDNPKRNTDKLEEYKDYNARILKVISGLDETRHVSEGNVLIREVRFLDRENHDRSEFSTNDYFKIRINYFSGEKITGPVFGIAIYTDSQILLTGPNTMHHNYKIDKIQGEGYIDYIIRRLPLLAGDYFVSVSIHDEKSYEPYVLRDRAYGFRVRNKEIKDFGKLLIKAEWDHMPVKG
ncbi:ABC transporter ATP-binding protein [Candidatus Woesearchaeota archaeon]|nr:ABC transporter ATP-binding protein [Candidatus Woesearchaeota archaeon]